MNLREQFEKLHPVPKNVVWLPSNEMYWTFTEFGETDIAAMKEQNALWKGFQSGHAAGLQDQSHSANTVGVPTPVMDAAPAWESKE